MRLDVYLKEKGFYGSREKARYAIEQGFVLVNGQIKSPSYKVKEKDLIKVLPLKYVSRGAFKLKKAIDKFGIEVKGKIALDLGSSTGGFVQVLLEEGASKVYAVDVGTNQLDEMLREDKRVVSFEGKDARDLSEEEIKEKVDILTADLSFISLYKIVPIFSKFLKSEAEIILLFKPQFELGREFLDKSGVVKDKVYSEKALQDFLRYLKKNGFSDIKTTLAPKGKMGNQEYLIYAKSMSNQNK